MAARRRGTAMQQWALITAAMTCACLAAAPLSAQAAASEYIADTEHFPGWKGALPAVEHGSVDAEDRHSRTLSVGALGKVRAPRCVKFSAWHRLFYKQVPARGTFGACCRSMTSLQVKRSLAPGVLSTISAVSRWIQQQVQPGLYKGCVDVALGQD